MYMIWACAIFAWAKIELEDGNYSYQQRCGRRILDAMERTPFESISYHLHPSHRRPTWASSGGTSASNPQIWHSPRYLYLSEY